MRRAFVDTPGGQVHCRIDGEGLPLVLLHMTVSSSEEYLEMMPFLANKYRVIAMDTPGYGESTQPPHAYEVTDYARSLKDSLDSLGLDQVALFGNKTGAAIALETAASYPDKIRRLVLFDYPYWAKAEDRLALISDPLYAPPTLKDDGSHLAEVWNMFKMFLSPTVPVETVQAAVMGHFRPGPRCQEAHHALFRYEPRPAMAKINCPTLLLSGTNGIFHSVVGDVQALIRGSEIVTIEGANFAATREMPRELAEAVKTFV